MRTRVRSIAKQPPSREYEAVSEKNPPLFSHGPCLTLHMRGFFTEVKTPASFTVSKLQLQWGQPGATAVVVFQNTRPRPGLDHARATTDVLRSVVAGPFADTPGLLERLHNDTNGKVKTVKSARQIYK